MDDRKIEVNAQGIWIDRKKTQILSGAIHYFRVFPEQWEDRIRKAAAMGLNAVETYVPWNLHEPVEGTFDFSGLCDLERFLDLIARNHLYAIVSPGPYICAETTDSPAGT